MSAEEHLKDKGIVQEAAYFTWHMLQYAKCVVKHGKTADNDEYGISVWKTKGLQKFKIIKYYYDGPIWLLRIYKLTVYFHFYS